MKTPMQELIETFEEMRSPIDSKVDVDFAISLVKSMLEKERNLLIAYEKQHYTPSEWILASEQCKKEIDEFLND